MKIKLFILIKFNKKRLVNTIIALFEQTLNFIENQNKRL